MSLLLDDKYDRVTSVLYPFSGLTKIDPAILKNAADRGSKVHEVLDGMINDLGDFGVDQAIRGYIDSFNQWRGNKDFIPNVKRFYNDELLLTGECDVLYKEPGGLVLVDFKTPAQESKTWSYQASAYSYLAKKEGYDINRLEFVKLDKTGKAPKVFTYDEDMDAFKKVLFCYRQFFKNCKENMLEFL